MTPKDLLRRLLQYEPLNFVLTNRIPRRALNRAVGWLSRLEHPWVSAAGIALWRLFADLDLSDARQRRFKSVHECFTRQLRDGARPIARERHVVVSPCDGLVGAVGSIGTGTLLQAKGQTYPLTELLADRRGGEALRDGCYVTLRLTAGMYHRFHAPYDCRVRRVTHIAGDTWNVNPSTLKRIERLYCRNERAVLECELAPGGARIVLVPVAAILVAGIRLRFLDLLLHGDEAGARVIDCDVPLSKGEEMGWFEHGSTIILLAPRGFTLCPHVHTGVRLRMGQALLQRQAQAVRTPADAGACTAAGPG